MHYFVRDDNDRVASLPKPLAEHLLDTREDLDESQDPSVADIGSAQREAVIRVMSS